MKIVSVVPIKLNSKRLPGKNIKKLNGRPMIDYILTTLDNCKKIDKNYVYCSSPKISRYLIKHKKSVFLKRDKSLDADNKNSTQIFSSFMDRVDADIYIFTHATAPLITSRTIDKCIDAVLSKRYDSAFTATKICNFAWINNKPNYNLKNLPRTQDLKPIFFETSGVYVFTKQVFKKYNARIGKKPYICIIPEQESVDVDELKDFEYAQFLLSKRCN